MKKRLIAMLLAMVLLALCAVPAMAEAPKVKKTEYEGNGVVEVEFAAKKVTYKNAAVVVKNAAGSKLKAKIINKDSDDISFKVTGLKAGSRYTYTISGVRKGSSGTFGKVSGSFKTPSNKPAIKLVKYDSTDSELEIDFATKVQFKNLKVSIVDEAGEAVTVKKIEKGSDDLEVKVAGVKKGEKYTVTVSGVRVKGVGKYVKVKKTFVA